MKFTAIVPLKTNSQRIPRKNFIMLAGKPLFLHIFETLLRVPMIDEVICWSSDEIFKNYLPSGVKFIKREKYLDGDDIKAKELFTAAAKQIKTDYFVLTHATAPFISSSSISKGISAILDGYDSSFSVKEIKNYCWFEEKTLNYDINNPVKTQDLKSIYFETSGFFIYPSSLMIGKGRRIGDNSKMIPVSDLESIDIDEKNDFEFAKLLESTLYKKDYSEYQMLQKKYKHLILDMDGVIINSLSVMKLAWHYCGGDSFAHFDEYKKFIGMPFKQICLKLNIPTKNIDLLEDKYFIYTEKLKDKIELYPNVKETLKHLKSSGIKLSIVSSKKHKNILSLLEKYEIEIDLIIAPEKDGYLGRHKPYGDPLLFACLEHKISVNDSIFLGDMLSDYNAALDANIDFIFANWGYGSNEYMNNVAVVKSFSQLEVLAK